MDVNIIIVGIISGVALILGIKNWSRNKEIDGDLNRLKLEKNILKEDVEKQINALKEEVNKLITPKEKDNPDKHKNEIPKPNEPYNITHPLTYFKIDQRWYRENRIIQVNFTQGRHQNVTYVYDHDYVYNQVIHIYRKKNCWINYGSYSCNTNIPKDIIKLVASTKNN